MSLNTLSDIAPNDYRVHKFEALKREGEDKAMALLKKLAAQVRPIMKKRQWRVGLLKEFTPKNPNLLGLNTNRGEMVNIRLRPARNLSEFYPYEELLGTMLHELVHNVHGPHDSKFYKLLDEITEECEKLMAEGITGAEGFDSDGRKVGGAFRNPSDAEKRKFAAQAAAKRSQMNTLMSGSGRALGGSVPKVGGRKMTPRELMLQAAQRRRKDNVWCGGDHGDGGEDGELYKKVCDGENSDKGGPMQLSDGSPPGPKSVPVKLPASQPPNAKNPPMPARRLPENGETRQTRPIGGVDGRGLKRERSMDGGDFSRGPEGWACPICTYVNAGGLKSCEMCACPAPELPAPAPASTCPPTTDWACPHCTYVNAVHVLRCDVCLHVAPGCWVCRCTCINPNMEMACTACGGARPLS